MLLVVVTLHDVTEGFAVFVFPHVQAVSGTPQYKPGCSGRSREENIFSGFPRSYFAGFFELSRFLSNEGGNDFLGTINLLPVCKTKPYERSRYVMSVAPKELLDVNTRIALFQNSLDLSCSSILPRSPLPFSRSPA